MDLKTGVGPMHWPENAGFDFRNLSEKKQALDSEKFPKNGHRISEGRRSLPPLFVGRSFPANLSVCQLLRRAAPSSPQPARGSCAKPPSRLCNPCNPLVQCSVRRPRPDSETETERNKSERPESIKSRRHVSAAGGGRSLSESWSRSTS